MLNIYEELRSKIRDLIRTITNNSDDFDEKYMKINFNSDNDLPLKKTLKLRNMKKVFLHGKHSRGKQILLASFLR